MQLRTHNVFHLEKLHLPQNNARAATPTVEDASSSPSIVERSASSSTCLPGNNSAICAKAEAASNMGPVIIGCAAGIPLVAALILLFFLHRRVRHKLRAEDANDRHRSLDFGMDEVTGVRRKQLRKGSKARPEMSIVATEQLLRPNMHGRGLSMEMSSPYLLPAALNGSRESFHSMSRSLQDPHDPYRPVTMIRGDNASSRSSSRPRQDNASTHTGSTANSGDRIELLKHASRMSRTESQMHKQPPVHSYDTYSAESARNPPPRKGSVPQKSPSKDRWYPDEKKDNTPLASTKNRWYPEDNKENGFDFALTKESIIDSGNDTGHPTLANHPLPLVPQPAQQPIRSLQERRNESQLQQDHNSYGFGHHNEALQITVPSPTHDRYTSPAPVDSHSATPAPPAIQGPAPTEYENYENYQDYAGDTRRVSVMGMRPLPPDDITDNPEQRANRIRSFYKEYFDDSRPNPPGHYPQVAAYDDGYTAELLDDGAIYDPETGAFYSTAQAPFAQPVSRRAMTPPPQGAGGVPPFMRGHRSAASTQSAQIGSRHLYPDARRVKKQLPPPAALVSLPTPHMLKDDMSTSAISFAPKSTFRDMQLGRGPDSPLGAQRPYSPAFRAHVPLARSFDDLSVMPSPHVLRMSGTFTGLDFAPPPRFKNQEGTGSDAGSIRSNRSGISAMSRDAVRAGAYRVSRIPQDVVTTKDDLSNQLKPTWDMRK